MVLPMVERLRNRPFMKFSQTNCLNRNYSSLKFYQLNNFSQHKVTGRRLLVNASDSFWCVSKQKVLVIVIDHLSKIGLFTLHALFHQVLFFRQSLMDLTVLGEKTFKFHHTITAIWKLNVLREGRLP